MNNSTIYKSKKLSMVGEKIEILQNIKKIIDEKSYLPVRNIHLISLHRLNTFLRTKLRSFLVNISINKKTKKIFHIGKLILEFVSLDEFNIIGFMISYSKVLRFI